MGRLDRQGRADHRGIRRASVVSAPSCSPREGARVVIADRDDGDDVVEAIGAAGGEALVRGRRTSVTTTAFGAAVEHTVETFGGLHVLYNNAGISPADDDGPENTSDETWQRVLDVNVTGIARCCRHGIPAMLASGGGSIVNVASFVAHMGAATPQIAYTAVEGRRRGDDARDRRRSTPAAASGPTPCARGRC